MAHFPRKLGRAVSWYTYVLFSFYAATITDWLQPPGRRAGAERVGASDLHRYGHASYFSPPSHRRVSAIAIAVPIAVVAVVLLLAFLLSRRCRNARNARHVKIDTRTARPFIPPTTSESVLSHTQLHFASDIKDPAMKDPAGMDRDDPPPTLQAIQRSGMAATSSPQDPGEGGILPADINRIVSMVVARIDPSQPPEHAPNSITTVDPETASYSQAFSPVSSSPPPAPESTRVTSIGMQPNVNIDTILTVLGARVDPSYREQAAFRDSTDLPPLYRLPPGYQG